MKKLIFTLLLASNALLANAVTLNIAVASNFTQPMKLLAAKYEQQSGNKLVMSYAGSGVLANQIKNGAPYAILLSADESTPKMLADSGYAVESSQFTYARGRLVLWSNDAKLVDKFGVVLEKGNFTHLAIADPKLAPYGAAAYQLLQKIGLLEQLTPKLVTGENISSTYQYVVSGNAELGFVALSQVYQKGRISSGSAWIIPEKLVPGIKQDAIILSKGKNTQSAEDFMKFLKSEPALQVIHQFGYK